MKSVRFAVALVLAGLTATGCGTNADESVADAVASATSAVASAAPTLSPPSVPSAVPSKAAPTAGAVVPTKRAAPGVVPKVVGMDHQLAQDTMQAAGFYTLSEEDATGQGRALLYDRNWVVIGQSPKAGTKASQDVSVVLRSKKKTD